MKKYITGGFRNKIDEVEVVKETEHTLWYELNGNKYNTRKNSKWCQVHDTFEQAKEFLLTKESGKKEHLQLQLDSCVKRIEEINQLNQLS